LQNNPAQRYVQTSGPQAARFAFASGGFPFVRMRSPHPGRIEERWICGAFKQNRSLIEVNMSGA